MLGMAGAPAAEGTQNGVVQQPHSDPERQPKEEKGSWANLIPWNWPPWSARGPGGKVEVGGRVLTSSTEDMFANVVPRPDTPDSMPDPPLGPAARQRAAGGQAAQAAEVPQHDPNLEA